MNETSRILFVRHAERPDIPDDEFGTDLPITNKGKKESVLFGNDLKDHIFQIITSPVKRCFETALAIKKGAECRTFINRSRLLGDPGIYIRDPITAGKNWQKYGHKKVCQKLFYDKKNIMEGFNNPISASKDLLKFFLSNMPPEGKTNICISHDIIIATFICHFFKLTDGKDFMPKFLEYIDIRIKNDEVSLRYRNLKRKIAFHQIKKHPRQNTKYKIFKECISQR